MTDEYPVQSMVIICVYCKKHPCECKPPESKQLGRWLWEGVPPDDCQHRWDGGYCKDCGQEATGEDA